MDEFKGKSAEKPITEAFNKCVRVNARKLGKKNEDNRTRHEYDLFDKGKVIGGISTGAHKTKNRKPNTGSTDRVEREIFWLELWPGPEIKYLILTDGEMIDHIKNTFIRVGLRKPIKLFWAVFGKRGYILKEICELK